MDPAAPFAANVAGRLTAAGDKAHECRPELPSGLSDDEDESRMGQVVVLAPAPLPISLGARVACHASLWRLQQAAGALTEQSDTCNLL